MVRRLAVLQTLFFMAVKKGISALFSRKEFYGIIVKQEGFVG